MICIWPIRPDFQRRRGRLSHPPRLGSRSSRDRLHLPGDRNLRRRPVVGDDDVEINYGGSTEEIRRYCLFGAQAAGNADRFKGFAEECMAEYGIDGWRVPDLTDPGELSYHVLRAGSSAG